MTPFSRRRGNYLGINIGYLFLRGDAGLQAFHLAVPSVLLLPSDHNEYLLQAKKPVLTFSLYKLEHRPNRIAPWLNGG